MTQTYKPQPRISFILAIKHTILTSSKIILYKKFGTRLTFIISFLFLSQIYTNQLLIKTPLVFSTSCPKLIMLLHRLGMQQTSCTYCCFDLKHNGSFTFYMNLYNTTKLYMSFSTIVKLNNFFYMTLHLIACPIVHVLKVESARFILCCLQPQNRVFFSQKHFLPCFICVAHIQQKYKLVIFVCLPKFDFMIPFLT